MSSAGGTPSSSPDRRAARPTQRFIIEEGLTKLADGTAGMARKLLSMQQQREATPETSSEKSRNPADVSAPLADPVWNDTTASVGVHLDITEAPSGWGEDALSIRQAQSNESLWDVGEEGESETPDAKGDDTCWDDESTGAGIIYEAAEVQSHQSWELELITTLIPADIPHRWEHFKKIVLRLELTSVTDRDILWQEPV